MRILRAPLPTAALVTACLAAGCFATGESARNDPAGDRRAALATVTVDNRTARLLSVAFLYAVEPGGAGGREVGVGTAAPGQTTRLAPVPAAEPIILIARAPGFERRLEPRTLDINERWTWVITEP